MELFTEHPDFLSLARASGYVYRDTHFPVMEHALAGLLFSVWPKTVLEYGTYKGWSTCLIAWALRKMGGERKIFTVDQEDQIEARTWVKTFQFEDLVEFRRSVTWEFVHEVSKYDFVFLDASHTYEGWKREWESIEKFLHPRTLVVVHDTLADVHWERLVEERLYVYNPFLLPMSGLTLLRLDTRHVVDVNWKLERAATIPGLSRGCR